MTELEFMERFGKNLERILKDAWMTQKELAEATNISESTISRYISGQMMPTAKTIVNICYELGINTDDLLDFGDRIV